MLQEVSQWFHWTLQKHLIKFQYLPNISSKYLLIVNRTKNNSSWWILESLLILRLTLNKYCIHFYWSCSSIAEWGDVYDQISARLGAKMKKREKLLNPRRSHSAKFYSKSWYILCKISAWLALNLLKFYSYENSKFSTNFMERSKAITDIFSKFQNFTEIFLKHFPRTNYIFWHF